jgi:lipopolysaccharide/colanic/teichoic acid biosynthesis glycosyltransferase
MGMGPVGYKVPVPAWKRILDLTVIGVTAPLWGPVMLFLVAGIKLVSPGPVLFRQKRIGLGEKTFTCLKFRTMRVDAETVSHQQHLTDLVKSDAPMKKMDHVDDRLIPAAWILRSTGLDELPQLFNVIRGEMSLVGPRPCTEFEFTKYDDQQRERFNALPGLTGLWQVSGKNETTFTKMIELDVHYSRTSCLWLDIGIMLRTFPAMLKQFVDNRLERAFLSDVKKRRRKLASVPAATDLVNPGLNANGAAR